MSTVVFLLEVRRRPVGPHGDVTERQNDPVQRSARRVTTHGFPPPLPRRQFRKLAVLAGDYISPERSAREHPADTLSGAPRIPLRADPGRAMLPCHG
jgi:hypothetical protein